MKKLLLLVSALAVCAPALAQRSNYNRNREFTSSDTVYDRAQASYGWSLVQNDYGSAPGYCINYHEFDTVTALPFDIGIDGTDATTPDYNGSAAVHTPCSGYDYLPTSNQNDIDHRDFVASDLFVQMYAARELAMYMDSYFGIDRRTQKVTGRLFSDRNDYIQTACDLNAPYCDHTYTGTTCTSDAGCSTGYSCFEQGFNSTSGKCATTDDEYPVGAFQQSPRPDDPGYWLVFWHDADFNDMDARSEYLGHSIHHEYGHYLTNIYESSDLQNSCYGSDDYQGVIEMLAEGFARLSMARHHHGEGAFPDFTDKAAGGIPFTWNSQSETRKQYDFDCTDGSAYNDSLAFGDALWEILYSVRCTWSSADCTDDDDVALEDYVGWGSTSKIDRLHVIARALANAMELRNQGNGSALNGNDVVKDFLSEFEDIKGLTMCTKARAIFDDHGFTVDCDGE